MTTTNRLNIQMAIMTLARTYGMHARPIAGGMVVLSKLGVVGTYTVSTIEQTRHAIGL